MEITFLGHVGMHVDTGHGSVLCDPWFTPAYFGSWFPFPRNDTLDVTRFEHPTYLYISHLHRDHFDPDWLRAHVDLDATVLLPEFRVPYLHDALSDLGFTRFRVCPSGERVDLDGLEVTIAAQNSPADGPLGDSLIAISDGETRILNQNDARPGRASELLAMGPFDAQFVQFSGAIWYPVAYDFPPDEKDRLSREKRANQMARARQYVEWVAAAHVFPCAGPPAFLDDDLFALNDLDDDPANIFPDQTVFLADLERHGINTGRLVVPGSVIELHGSKCEIRHPTQTAASEPFADKRRYLERYAADMRPWLEAERASWAASPDDARPHRDLVAELAPWFEPLLARAPITSSGVGGVVVIRASGTDIAIDFVEGTVRRWAGEPAIYRVDVDRRLIEACIDRHEEDWVNSLFLSARFVAHREGGFNEYVMTFFKALSPERIDHVERCYSELRHDRDEWFELDGWEIERFCPHRQADLVEFAEIDGGVLTCALHHWQFDLESGRCLTSDDRRLRCRRLD